jgi:hypothetical protein
VGFGLFSEYLFYDLGISWEYRGKNLELLYLIINHLKENMNISWEYRGNNLGKSIENKGEMWGKRSR